MKKITKLTPEQESKITEYRDHWIARGTSVEPVSLQRAIEIIHPLQTELLGRQATPVVMMPSPLHAWMAVCLLASTRDQVGAQVWAQVRDQVGAQVGAQVWAQVWAQVRDQVGAQVGAQVRDQVRAQVWDQVRDQVGAQVGAQVRAQVGDIFKSFIWPYLCGSFDSGAFSFYDYFLAETAVEITPELRRKYDIWQATSELGICYPLEHACVVSQKPKAIRRNENGLHCEGGMAVEFDGCGFWALNGVRVPEYLAMTPSEDLDIEWFKSQDNADVRTEFVRKYGVERMLSMGTRIDTHENYDEPWWTRSAYELWDMARLFPNLEYQPYLKMQNQTTQVWHVEAVSPACRTLADAIKERFGGRDFKIRAIA